MHYDNFQKRGKENNKEEMDKEYDDKDYDNNEDDGTMTTTRTLNIATAISVQLSMTTLTKTTN